MRQCKIVYVHGINNGVGDIPHIQSTFQFFHDSVRKTLPIELEKQARIAYWRSSGDFVYDLQMIFTRPSLRDYAVNDIQQVILRALNGSTEPVLVVGHSMGQVLAYMALRDLNISKYDKNRLGLVTFGGPLGNTNPIYKNYLRTIGALDDEKSCPSKFWHDVANFDDPICCNVQGQVEGLLTSVLPKQHSKHILSLVPSFLRQQSAYEKLQSMDTSTFIAVEGIPPPSDPFSEHGSYFYSSECVSIVASSVNSLLETGASL